MIKSTVFTSFPGTTAISAVTPTMNAYAEFRIKAIESKITDLCIFENIEEPHSKEEFDGLLREAENLFPYVPTGLRVWFEGEVGESSNFYQITYNYKEYLWNDPTIDFG